MHRDQRPPNCLLQALPPADFEEIRQQLQIVDLIKDAMLIGAGSTPSQVYFPHAGIVSLMVSLSEGQAVEVAMIGCDGVVGASEALGDATSLTDATVLCPGTASALAVSDLRALADRSAALRGLLARHALALFAQAQQSAACNASHSVEERLSRWLLHARDLWNGETLPLTQERLARMIGVQRNAVSIVAHALQQAGTLSYSRGQIEIIDAAALMENACECYRAVKTRQSQLFE
jgi:CRP-like cAMP-binding protein